MRPLRVTVLDNWEEIAVPYRADASVAEIKRAALEAAQLPEDPAGFAVKYLGAELRDEQQTAAQAGLPDGAALIVLRRRRRAVR